MSTPKEKPFEEPKLSGLERVECVNRLIDGFKKILGNSSRFQEMLSRTYFSVIPGEVEGLTDNPIPFQSGENLYNVLYIVSDGSKGFKQVLKIQKSPVGEEREGDLERVTLMTGAESLGKQPAWGAVAYTRHSLSDKAVSPQEYHLDTATAVRKVRGILKDVVMSSAEDFDKKVDQEKQVEQEMRQFGEKLMDSESSTL